MNIPRELYDLDRFMMEKDAAGYNALAKTVGNAFKPGSILTNWFNGGNTIKGMGAKRMANTVQGISSGAINGGIGGALTGGVAGFIDPGDNPNGGNPGIMNRLKGGVNGAFTGGVAGAVGGGLWGGLRGYNTKFKKPAAPKNQATNTNGTTISRTDIPLNEDYEMYEKMNKNNAFYPKGSMTVAVKIAQYNAVKEAEAKFASFLKEAARGSRGGGRRPTRTTSNPSQPGILEGIEGIFNQGGTGAMYGGLGGAALGFMDPETDKNPITGQKSDPTIMQRVKGGLQGAMTGAVLGGGAGMARGAYKNMNPAEVSTQTAGNPTPTPTNNNQPPTNPTPTNPTHVYTKSIGDQDINNLFSQELEDFRAGNQKYTPDFSKVYGDEARNNAVNKMVGEFEGYLSNSGYSPEDVKALSGMYRRNNFNNLAETPRYGISEDYINTIRALQSENPDNFDALESHLNNYRNIVQKINNGEELTNFEIGKTFSPMTNIIPANMRRMDPSITNIANNYMNRIYSDSPLFNAYNDWEISSGLGDKLPWWLQFPSAMENYNYWRAKAPKMDYGNFVGMEKLNAYNPFLKFASTGLEDILAMIDEAEPVSISHQSKPEFDPIKQIEDQKAKDSVIEMVADKLGSYHPSFARYEDLNKLTASLWDNL